jgi:hypothetical protein
MPAVSATGTNPFTLLSLIAAPAVIGCFAFASLVSIVGAGIASSPHALGLQIATVASLAAGVLGVGSLVYGCIMLVRETRLAVFTISEETRFIEEGQRVSRQPPPDSPV